MSFLKNLQEKALNTAQVIGNKSQEVVEVGKLKLQISQLEGDIKKLKSEIGELVYAACANGQEYPGEQVAKIAADISAKYTEIESTKAKIQEVQAKSE